MDMLRGEFCEVFTELPKIIHGMLVPLDDAYDLTGCVIGKVSLDRINTFLHEVLCNPRLVVLYLTYVCRQSFWTGLPPRRLLQIAQALQTPISL